MKLVYLLPLLVALPVKISAQQKDSSDYSYYDSAIPDLLPATTPFRETEEAFGRDSATVVQQAHGKTASVIYGSANWFKDGKKPAVWDSVSRKETYVFNKNGRLTEVDKQDGFELHYLYSGTKFTGSVTTWPGSWDSLTVVYNRAGQISGYYRRYQDDKGDHSYSPVFLYDNAGHIVVAENVAYNEMLTYDKQKRGTCTYEYNSQGRLIMRRFLDRTGGTVICSDTIIYRYTKLHKLTYIDHLFKTSGGSEWMLVDSQKMDTVLQKPVRCVLSMRIYVPPFGMAGMGTMDMTYGNDGRLVNSVFTFPDQKKMLRSEYNYSVSADTMTAYEIVNKDGQLTKNMVFRTILTYNSKGLLVSKKFEYYEEYEEDKKVTHRLQARFTSIYSWKN